AGPAISSWRLDRSDSDTTARPDSYWPRESSATRCPPLHLLDLRQLDEALPALGLGLQERRHRLGRAGEDLDHGAGKEFLRLGHRVDLVEPGGELVDDRPRRAGRHDHAPPWGDVEVL